MPKTASKKTATKTNPKEYASGAKKFITVKNIALNQPSGALVTTFNFVIMRLSILIRIRLNL